MIEEPRQPLISSDELEQRIGRGGLVVLDCRHSLTEPGAGQAAFKAGHIPGARHVDLDRDLSRSAGAHEGRHPLPELAEFVQTLRRLGISNDSEVVVYDDCGGALAARLWWMLSRWLGHQNVAVLDGGIDAWRNGNYAIEQGPAVFEPGAFIASRAGSREIVTTEELVRKLERGAVCLVDARAAARFEGRTEPIDPVAGHVPGAVNLPFTELLTDQGRFRPPGQIRDRFAHALGAHDPRDVVAMCGSGVTACHLLLGMQVAGMAHGRLYVGSWSEWIRDPTRPIVASNFD